MRLMVIRVIKDRSESNAVINPERIESMEEAGGMSRIIMAGGREYCTEIPIDVLHTMWMMSMHPEYESGYNEGASAVWAKIQRRDGAEKEDAETEEHNGSDDT